MEDLKITGEVEDIIYRNKDNGYTVFSLTTEDDEVTCVGVVPQIHSGEALEIHGSWAMHPLYGRQVQVQYYEKSMPTTISGWAKTGRERFKRCWIDFPSSRACISSFCQESYVQKSSCRNEKTADTLLLTAIETGAGSSSGSSSVQRRKRELLSSGREEREPICSSVQRKTRCAVAAEPV